MTKEELDHLAALERGASGPWCKTAGGCCGPAGTVYAITPQFTDRGCMTEKDADLIIALRRHAPQLIAAARERDELVGVVVDMLKVLCRPGFPSEKMRVIQNDIALLIDRYGDDAARALLARIEEK